MTFDIAAKIAALIFFTATSVVVTIGLWRGTVHAYSKYLKPQPVHVRNAVMWAGMAVLCLGLDFIPNTDLTVHLWGALVIANIWYAHTPPRQRGTVNRTRTVIRREPFTRSDSRRLNGS